MQTISKKNIREKNIFQSYNSKAILKKRTNNKYPVLLSPLSDYAFVPPLNTLSISIPTAEPTVTTPKSTQTTSRQKSIRIPPAISTCSCKCVTKSAGIEDNYDDDYDEGGFTPRIHPPKPDKMLNKLPKIPAINTNHTDCEPSSG